jgi:hypothetical protein
LVAVAATLEISSPFIRFALDEFSPKSVLLAYASV